MACWGGLIPVEAYLRAEISPEQWDLFCRQEPQYKLSSLIDLVRKAREVQS